MRRPLRTVLSLGLVIGQDPIAGPASADAPHPSEPCGSATTSTKGDDGATTSTIPSSALPTGRSDGDTTLSGIAKTEGTATIVLKVTDQIGVTSGIGTLETRVSRR